MPLPVARWSISLFNPIFFVFAFHSYQLVFHDFAAIHSIGYMYSQWVYFNQQTYIYI